MRNVLPQISGAFSLIALFAFMFGYWLIAILSLIVFAICGIVFWSNLRSGQGYQGEDVSRYRDDNMMG